MKTKPKAKTEPETKVKTKAIAKTKTTASPMLEAYQTYNVLGYLLEYPGTELIACLPDMERILIKEKLLKPAALAKAKKLISHLKSTMLLDLQETYVGLFDRNRLLSLHLFEHVWGESRRRGQAMVDLTEMYKQHDLSLESSELPDYLPAFLEFVSSVSPKLADELLGDVVDIFSIMAERLSIHQSPYQACFEVLLTLSSKKPNKKVVDKALIFGKKKEKEKSIDDDWEDEAVTFGPGAIQSDCASCHIHQNYDQAKSQDQTKES
jgi:nitrate reductase molybdenum cofactor assembly chaperone NarJ/NarW